MKYRSDFVTNSSSSSYIIAYQKTSDYDEETLKKYPALSCFNRLLDTVLIASSEYAETDKGTKLTTKEDLDAFFVERYGWRDESLEAILSEDKYCKEQYEKCLNAIQRGCIVFFKEIDYNDYTLSSIIRDLGKENIGVEIIEYDG